MDLDVGGREQPVRARGGPNLRSFKRQHTPLRSLLVLVYHALDEVCPEVHVDRPHDEDDVEGSHWGMVEVTKLERSASVARLLESLQEDVVLAIVQDDVAVQRDPMRIRTPPRKVTVQYGM